jgi:hypothetical protein
MMNKVIAIRNQAGKVIATQIGESIPDRATGSITRIVAGPSQTLHTVDFEVPTFQSTDDIEAFHRNLTELLRR